MIKKYIQKTMLILGFASVIGFSGVAVMPADTSAQAHSFAASECLTEECRNLYSKYINPAVRLLSAAVGVVVVLMIVVGGVQYSSAGSDPQKVAEARKKITNAIVALLTYIFLFALLNWLVPGGVV